MHDSDMRTRLATPLDALARVSEASVLFARAFAFLPRSPRFGREHGYRVFWLEGSELRFRDVVEHPASYAILGRHSRAHVRLCGDPTIALRHFVLRARRSADGAPELHVSDLLSPLPLFVDGSPAPQYACAVQGAFSARLGAHALCALPFDGCATLPAEGGPGLGDRPDEDDEDDDDCNPDDVAVPQQGGARVIALPARAPAVVAPREDGFCTERTRSSHIQQLERQPLGRGGIVLELASERGSSNVWVSDDQLEALVVLGRYERCRAGASVFSSLVSRMHVGITRTAHGIEVLDLASTNGVRIDGVRVRRGIVRDRSMITLAEADFVRVRMAA